MNEKIIDSLNVNKNLMIGTSSQVFSDFWFWVALIEFIIIAFIVFLIWKQKTKTLSKKDKHKKEGRNSTIDFGNIINSSFNSRQLYDELKRKCHPDRFVDDKDKNEYAEKLFQEISKNQTNYDKLIELKHKAKEILNINF